MARLSCVHVLQTCEHRGALNAVLATALGLAAVPRRAAQSRERALSLAHGARVAERAARGRQLERLLACGRHLVVDARYERCGHYDVRYSSGRGAVHSTPLIRVA